MNLIYITKQGIIREESACYELHKIEVDITNPFDKEGEFRVVTIETMEDPEQQKQSHNSKYVCTVCMMRRCNHPGRLFKKEIESLHKNNSKFNVSMK